MLNRREFIETSVLATVLPFEQSADEGYWDFDGVREDGQISFARFNGRGEKCASCVVGGEIGSWEVRKAVWGGQIQHSREFSDRAEALEHARDWMAET